MVFSLFGRGGDWCLLPLGEVELVVGVYPSNVRWIGCCLAKGLPLLCEVVFVLREEFGTPIVDWKSFTVVKAGM